MKNWLDLLTKFSPVPGDAVRADRLGGLHAGLPAPPHRPPGLLRGLG